MSKSRYDANFNGITSVGEDILDFLQGDGASATEVTVQQILTNLSSIGVNVEQIEAIQSAIQAILNGRAYNFTYQDISDNGVIPACHGFCLVNLGPGNITISSGAGTLPAGGSLPASAPGEKNYFNPISYTVPEGTTGKLAIIAIA